MDLFPYLFTYLLTYSPLLFGYQSFTVVVLMVALYQAQLVLQWVELLVWDIHLNM